MGQTWEEILQEGAFGGVKFDFVSVRDDQSNDLDQQKYPGKDGSRIVPRGRNSATFDIMAIVIEEDYPEKMYDLIAQLGDGGVVKKFVHPIFGELNASCARFTVNHDVEDARDSCTIAISLIEAIDEDTGPVAAKNTTPARANAIRSLGTEVLEALSAFQAALDIQNSQIGLAITGAVNAAEGMAAEMEASFSDLSTLVIQATANGVLAEIDEAVALVADYDTTECYDLSAVTLSMGHAVRDMANELIEQRPPLSTFICPDDTNILQLAHDNGQDADELLTLNSFPDPSLILAGTKWRGYAE